MQKPLTSHLQLLLYRGLHHNITIYCVKVVLTCWSLLVPDPEVQRSETGGGRSGRETVAEVNGRPPRPFDVRHDRTPSPSVRGRLQRRRGGRPFLYGFELDDSAGRRVFDRQQLHVVAAGRMYDAGRGHGERLQSGRSGHGRHQPGGQQYGHQHGGRHDAAPEHQHDYDDYDGAPGAGAAAVGRRRRPAVVVVMVVVLLLVLEILVLVVVVVLVARLLISLRLMVMLAVGSAQRLVLAARRRRRTVVRLRQYRILELGRQVTRAVLRAHRLQHGSAVTLYKPYGLKRFSMKNSCNSCFSFYNNLQTSYIYIYMKRKINCR